MGSALASSQHPVESRGTWATCAELQVEGVLRTASKRKMQSQAEMTWTFCFSIAMSAYQIDLNVAELAYMFGFLQADGHLYSNTRNRGRLSLELKVQDAWLVEQFARLVPFYSSIRTRTRRTNFSEIYSSVIWTVHDRSFREALIAKGLPQGKKSDIISIPDGEFAQVDYYRGIVDADGSLGITAQGIPFVSLMTVSEPSEIASWQRPAGRRKYTLREWDREQDEFILSHSVEEAERYLERTSQSIKMRLWRLRGKKVTD